MHDAGVLSTNIHSSSVEPSGRGREETVPLLRRRPFSTRRGEGRKYEGFIDLPTR